MNSALIHSLWQGSAIAFGLAVALVFVRSARMRYALACTAMAVMLGAFVWTLSREMPQGQGVFPLPSKEVAAGIDLQITAIAERRWPALEQWWAMGVALVGLWRVVGWTRVQRLRRRGVCSVALEWCDRTAVLATRLGVARAVCVLDSVIIETPLTFGVLRPVVLIPAGLLTGLPMAQVEAILLHELAHIRRHDYLVNLLQAAGEAMLFYHPAAWWVSHVIRREREFCCDEEVVRVTGDAGTYAHALAALEQYRGAEVGIAATGGALMQRIQRLVGGSQRGVGSVAPALVFLLIASVAAGCALRPKQSAATTPAPAISPAPQAAGKSELKQKSVARAKRNGLDSRYEKWLNGEVVWIIQQVERTAFLQLRTDDERQRFIEQFWLRRDPTPDTAVNELMEEHYRRIAWSNDRFTTEKMAGWQSDRGIVYIKYGPPDEREEHPDSIDSHPYEKWRYRHLDGVGDDVFIEFVDSFGDNGFHMTWDPND